MKTEISRYKAIETIKEVFETHPIVAILGPRQCGKTTLARSFAGKNAIFFDLEDPRDLESLANPMLALENLTGLIVIDEIQRIPNLFQVLRVLIDKNKLQQRYLILGSASRDLISQSSETLAGRIGYIELRPFSLNEVLDEEQLWICGGFPNSYLAKNKKNSFLWLKSYIASYLERDLPNLGFRVSPASIRKFWLMLAHYHGQIFNASEIGRSLGISSTSIKDYLGILSGTFMVRELKPWIENNLNKRQVKSPKIYFRDSGIFHTLLGINNKQELRTHPKLGASWEGFALEQVLAKSNIDSESAYFWATHSGAELDLFINDFGKRSAFEFKYSDAPKLSPSMKIAIQDLGLNKLSIIYPGPKSYKLSDDIEVISLAEYMASPT